MTMRIFLVGYPRQVQGLLDSLGGFTLAGDCMGCWPEPGRAEVLS